MSDAYFHEDDYGQVELLPLAAYEFCVNQSQAIEEFSAEHRTPDRTPDRMGWTDMFIRDDPPAKLEALAIPCEEFRALVGQYLPEYSRVFTGYSTYREQLPRTTALGRE